MGKIGTRWGHPIVLFSKGKKQNKSVPASAFPNQALHCDSQPEVANANAWRRGKPDPYSVIINSSPEDVIIHGRGLRRFEIFGVKNGKNKYPDLTPPRPHYHPHRVHGCFPRRLCARWDCT